MGLRPLPATPQIRSQCDKLPLKLKCANLLNEIMLLVLKLNVRFLKRSHVGLRNRNKNGCPYDAGMF